MSSAPKVAILNRNLLKREKIAVTTDGDLVILKLGNVEVKLEYETALLFSQWVRLGAKQAKNRAGDTSRHWSVIGVMHDANQMRG